MRALFDITLKRGLSSISSHILTLCKCVEHRQWMFEHPLRQFAGNRLNPDLLNKLEAKRTDILRLKDMSQDEIGMVDPQMAILK